MCACGLHPQILKCRITHRAFPAFPALFGMFAFPGCVSGMVATHAFPGALCVSPPRKWLKQSIALKLNTEVYELCSYMFLVVSWPSLLHRPNLSDFFRRCVGPLVGEVLWEVKSEVSTPGYFRRFIQF